MKEVSFALAHNTPTIYSDDVLSPFNDIGMGDWSDQSIVEFFRNKRVIDIGSGYEGLARRLHALFGNKQDAPEVTNLNPQFTDWRMADTYIDGTRNSTARSKRLDIEDGIERVMLDGGEDFEAYMAQRIVQAGIVQDLEYEDGYFDIQISTWGFPNVLYDCSGSNEYGESGYREILRTQKVGGVALLAPIRRREEAHVLAVLDGLGVPHTSVIKPATNDGGVLELQKTG